jgi:hypothetical protein
MAAKKPAGSFMTAVWKAYSLVKWQLERAPVGWQQAIRKSPLVSGCGKAKPTDRLIEVWKVLWLVYYRMERLLVSTAGKASG